MSGPRITVRMYQGLLGDCFLLRLFDGDGEVDRSAPANANILIDCGIIQGASQARPRMERVAASIRKDTNDHLDLLVVTHEHFDHLSGFSMARDVFLDGASIRIDNIWLAWTEKDGDADAERLRTMFDKTRMAIAAGMERMAASEHLARRHAHATAGGGPAGYGFDDFLGPLDMGATGHLTTRATLSMLKEKVAPPAREFLEPGQAKRTPGTVGLRAFVLGPPRNFTRLFNDLPSSRAEDRETYFAARAGQVAASQRNFAMGDDGGGLEGMPFSRRYQQVSDAALLADDLTMPAPDAPSAQHNLWEIRATYLSLDSGDADAGRWRTIDDDWCGAVGALAIKLDSDTNNSSLVLAFETEPGGDILLFAADAQVGNWLSWHDQPYPKDAAEDDRVSANELLARTLLYKVGHHGSHNATLGKAGLEMMTHPRLVAMLPNVKAMAVAKKWPFPHPELYQRLIEKTGGRILTGDEPPGPAALANDGDFAKRVRVGPDDPTLGPLWVEYDAR